MRKIILCAVAALVFSSGAAFAIGAKKPPAQDWSFDGIFGTYDRAALRRGFQVFNEICTSCHSLRLVAYRNLLDIDFTEDEAKAIASEFEVEDGPNEEGEMYTRPAMLSDRFAPPFANDNAARAANNGALPPDLSLIIKARPVADHKGPQAGPRLPLRPVDRIQGRAAGGLLADGRDELQRVLPGPSDRHGPAAGR